LRTSRLRICENTAQNKSSSGPEFQVTRIVPLEYQARRVATTTDHRRGKGERRCLEKEAKD
jgi:hypothetical protein